MPFLLLLFLTLPCLPANWQSRWDWVDSPGKSAALTWASVLVEVGLAFRIAYRVRRHLAGDPSRRDALLPRYGRWRFYHMLSLFVLYTISLFGFGWGWAAQTICSWGGEPIPGVELVILAPFLTALVLSWVCFYDAERALHKAGPAAASAEPFWGRGTYVSFHVRHNLALVCVPIGLLILEKSARRLLPDLGDLSEIIVSVLGLIAALCVFACMPWILRLALGLRPMPPGPLRDRLLATARRLNCRCSDILLWNTRGHVANAMVAGFLPILRYVLLTDRLVAELTPDEVEAVFGHEVGHVKHHHMLYYLGFMLASLVVVLPGALPLLEYFELKLGMSKLDELQALSIVTVLGAYIFVVFGFLSRRCERQADIYGCRTVSCTQTDCQGHDLSVVPAPAGEGLCPTGIHTFIAALEKVAHLNGISRDRPGWLQSWQHSTIARRVEFLQRMLLDPSLEQRFQRTVAVVKWVMLAILVVVGALLFFFDRTA